MAVWAAEAGMPVEIRAHVWVPEAMFGFTQGVTVLPDPISGAESIARHANGFGRIVGQAGGLAAGEGIGVVWDHSQDPPQILTIDPLTATLVECDDPPASSWSRAMEITESSDAIVVGESSWDIVKSCG